MNVDGWLKSKAQDSYLWLLDHTGVYCATLRLGLLICSFIPDIIRGNHTIVILTIICFWGVSHGMSYYWQDTKKYEVYNVSAMEWEAAFFRKWGVPIIMIGAVLNDYRHGWYWDPPFDLLIWVWSYLSTATIRDREPPEKEVREVVLLTGAIK